VRARRDCPHELVCQNDAGRFHIALIMRRAAVATET
jgi:hypothetical protein